MFVVVTLSGREKLSKCVPKKWIFNYDKYKTNKYKKVHCFISENLSAEPKFDLDHSEQFIPGVERLYKVFIKKEFGK